MSNRKHHESMAKLDKCYSAVQQSGAKGIRAPEIAKKLSVNRSTVYSYLRSLDIMGKVESDQGIWHAKTGEQTIKPLEKEIVIELPLTEEQRKQIASMEVHAKYFEDIGLLKRANLRRIILETFKETRTIRIKGKNVDDLDLEKLAKLIKQANEKSSRINLRGLFKGSKKSQSDTTKQQ